MTDERTAERTDIPSCRDPRTHLKTDKTRHYGELLVDAFIDNGLTDGREDGPTE